MAISTKTELMNAIKQIAANPSNKIKYKGQMIVNYDYVYADLYMAGANTHFTDEEIEKCVGILINQDANPYIPSYEYSDFADGRPTLT